MPLFKQAGGTERTSLGAKTTKNLKDTPAFRNRRQRILGNVKKDEAQSSAVVGDRNVSIA